MDHPIRNACAVLVAYVGLAIAITWPLTAHLPTHLPQRAGIVWADQYYIGWALAWQTHALATEPARFADANIYWPARLALFHGSPGFALLPIFAPIFLLTANPTLALNATLLLALALTATSLHCVTRRWTGSTLAGVATGATYLVSAPREPGVRGGGRRRMSTQSTNVRFSPAETGHLHLGPTAQRLRFGRSVTFPRLCRLRPRSAAVTPS